MAFTGYLAFSIENQSFAIPIDKVRCVIRSQELIKITEPPRFVDGLINYHGEIIPVINLRRRLGLPEKNIDINDRFIQVLIGDIVMILIVDHVVGLIDANVELLDSKLLHTDFRFIKIFKSGEGIVLIYSIEELMQSIPDIDIKSLIAENSHKMTSI